MLAWAERHITAAALPGQSPKLQLDPALAEAAAQDATGSWREVGAALHIWAAEAAARTLQ